MAAQRRIWLVADDYGISPAVSAAIRDLAAQGRLSGTSVMVTAPSFDRAQALALAAIENVAIGLHTTLTAPFRPLTPGFAPTQGGACLPLTALTARACLGRLDHTKLAAEIVAQVEAFAAAFGRPPDFVDGHQHVQLAPVVRDALLAVTKEMAPRAWVRQCGSVTRSISDPKGLFIDWLSRRFRALAQERGLATNPAFAGTYTFEPSAQIAALFPGFLAGLPDGGVVMCHPGEVDDELRRLDPLTDLRAREYDYLAGDAFAALLRSQGVSLS